MAGVGSVPFMLERKVRETVVDGQVVPVSSGGAVSPSSTGSLTVLPTAAFCEVSPTESVVRGFLRPVTVCSFLGAFFSTT